MKLKRIAAWGLAITMTLSLDIPGVNAASGVIDTTLTPTTISDADREAQIKTATVEKKLPGTNREFFTGNEDIREWFNVSGYAADGVQDRSEYYEEFVNAGKNTSNYVFVHEDGYIHNTTQEYKTEEEWNQLSADEQKDYTYKSAERQFTEAFSTRPKVVQVDAKELELGYKYLQKEGLSGSMKEADDDDPITSPVIMETGISYLNLYSHLTIFSTTGCIIRHAGINLEKCNDVIIRNFQFEGLYEWDEPSYNAKLDSHKRFGWCNLTCNNSNDIWVDHCTFGFAFDGNIDLKNGSSASITWCQFGVQDLDTNSEESKNPLPKWNESEGSELWKNILYMEECYQEYVKDHAKTDKYFPEYYSLRGKDAGNGATPKEIMEYAAYHSKVHLVGSGEKDFYTNVNEKISLGFNKYTSVIQRIPMIRSGNGHMYNCIVDNSELKKHVEAITSNKNAITDGVHFYSSYISVNNARNGATIGTDTSIFKEVSPNCGGETQALTGGEVDDWKSTVKNMVNHNLVVNSRVTIDGKTEEGSNWDGNGDKNALMNRKWTWGDKSSIGDFKWVKWENLDDFLNEGPLDTNKVAQFILAYKGDFYKDYYVGQYELEYDYKCFNLNDVEDKLATYGGAKKDLYGNGSTEPKEQDPLDYIQPYNDKVMEKTYAKKVILNTDGGTITDKNDNTYYLKKGDSITLPSADEITKYGYDLAGWKKGSYANGSLVLDDEFLKDTTIPSNEDEFTTEYYFAQWTRHNFSVTYVVINGTKQEMIGELLVPYEQRINSVGKSPTPSPKEGATFLGWYLYNPETQTYGGLVPDSAGVTEDLVLYAKWRNTITFETNGGTEIASKKVESGNTIGSIADPTKEGLIFAGWYKDADLTEPFDPKTDKVMEPMTLYAKWVEEMKLGDVDDNGKINADDALAILKKLAKLDVPKYVESAADVDGNGKVNADDALLILKVCAKVPGAEFVAKN